MRRDGCGASVKITMTVYNHSALFLSLLIRVDSRKAGKHLNQVLLEVSSRSSTPFDLKGDCIFERSGVILAILIIETYTRQVVAASRQPVARHPPTFSFHQVIA